MLQSGEYSSESPGADPRAEEAWPGSLQPVPGADGAPHHPVQGPAALPRQAEEQAPRHPDQEGGTQLLTVLMIVT